MNQAGMPFESLPNVYRKAEATTRLYQLGLTRDDLLRPVTVGLSYSFECTTFAPPSFRGLIAWGKTVESLRLELAMRDWTPNNARNYATVVHPDGTHAIGIASGDSATGTDLDPSTRSEKGTETKIAVQRNQLSFAEIDRFFPLPVSEATMQTWFLLYFADDETENIRLELSLPRYMSPEGRVTTWLERILFDPIEFDSINASRPQDIKPTDEQDILVKKRA